jgi:DNA-binding CsgD family transcriptional regulator
VPPPPASPPENAPGSARGLLDGKTFYGDEGPSAGERHPQMYIFRDGTFEAPYWRANGITAAPNTAKAEGDRTRFEAVTAGSRSEYGEVRWQGTVSGDSVEVRGEYVSMRPGGERFDVQGKARLTPDRLLLKRFLDTVQKLPRFGTEEYERRLQLANQAKTMATIRNQGTALWRWLGDRRPARAAPAGAAAGAAAGANGQQASIFDAVRAGASGYLLKNSTRETMVAAVEGTAAGKTFVDPAVAGRLFGNVQGAPAPLSPLLAALSPRERDVLTLLGRGLNNAAIAERCHLSEGTVRNIVSVILSKLQVEDRTQAALLAVRLGLAVEP